MTNIYLTRVVLCDPPVRARVEEPGSLCRQVTKTPPKRPCMKITSNLVGERVLCNG